MPGVVVPPAVNRSSPSISSFLSLYKQRSDYVVTSARNSETRDRLGALHDYAVTRLTHVHARAHTHPPTRLHAHIREAAVTL